MIAGTSRHSQGGLIDDLSFRGSNSLGLVSVVVPAYNCALYLQQAIESIRVQTYRSVEIIIIDDGSTDNTPDVIKNLGDDIISIRQPNCGPAGTRNKGIDAATGEFIAFLDADDVWLPSKLEKQIEYLDTHPEVALVYSQMMNFIDGQDAGADIFPQVVKSGRLFDDLLKNTIIPLPTVVVRAKVVRDVGSFDESLLTAEDTNFYLKVAYTYHIGVVPEVLLLRRLHASNLSFRVDISIGTLDNLDRIAERYPEVHPTRYPPMLTAYKIRGESLIKDYFNKGEYRKVREISSKLVGLGIRSSSLLVYRILMFLPDSLVHALRTIRRGMMYLIKCLAGRLTL